MSNIELVISQIKKSSLIISLFFTTLLMQNLIRNMKDSLIVTYISPEVISYIKLYAEIPLGIMFFIIYTLICNHFSPEKAFRYVVSFFILFFFVFSFFLLPNLTFFLPDKVYIDSLSYNYPYLKWFVIIWGNWCLVLFYIFGELLTIVLCTILFWQLANKVNSSCDAKKYYPLYTFFGQINLIASSQIIYWVLAKYQISYQSYLSKTEDIFQLLTIILCLCGLFSLAIQKYIDKQYISKDTINNQVINQKNRLTLHQSITTILSSKYLVFIFFLVFSYGVCVILIEGLWFSKAKEKYPLISDFMHYHATVMLWVGISCIGFSVLGKFVLKYCSWLVCAIITPLVFMTLGSFFFVISYFQTSVELIINYQALSLIVFLGGLQNIISKGSKYTLFDMSKEMSYIPLKEPIKTEGKAAVDLIGFKLGKAMGAFIPFFIFTLYPSYNYQDIVLQLLVFFLLFCAIWLYSVKNLSMKYNNLTNYKNTIIN
jgi:ATP/ADP translocase